MRKFLTISLSPALPIFLAVTVLAACGGTGGATDTAARAPAEARAASDTSATSAPPPTTGARTDTTQARQADTYDDDDGYTTTAPSPAPTITEVRVDPELPREGAFYTLPAGAGQVRLMTAAGNADRVRFFLVPTGTGTRDLAQHIGDATSSEADGRTWWVYDWSYPAEAMLAHLLVEASGSGGTTEQTPFGFYHGL